MITLRYIMANCFSTARSFPFNKTQPSTIIYRHKKELNPLLKSVLCISCNGSGKACQAPTDNRKIAHKFRQRYFSLVSMPKPFTDSHHSSIVLHRIENSFIVCLHRAQLLTTMVDCESFPLKWICRVHTHLIAHKERERERAIQHPSIRFNFVW